MKSSDRTILLALAVIGVVAGAWFLLISPKRDEVSKLDDQIAAVESSVHEQEQLVAIAEQARDRYDTDYRDLVVLGKAVPGEADTSSLFVELEAIAATSGVDFDAIELDEGSGEAPPPPPASQTTADDAQPAESPTSPVATEASAALLPIGATIGPAGLPVMPYTITLTGDFFEISNFLAGVDALVSTRKASPLADGRLVTVSGFELKPDEQRGFPVLDAALSVSTYVSPADQGLTGGATPAAPATTESAAVPTTNETTP